MDFDMLLNEEMAEKAFYKQAMTKTPIMILGYGSTVDTHGSSEAIKKFTEVILRHFPTTRFEISLNGRFGMDKRSGSWAFEQQMGGSGHPSNWREDSRGYYCMTNKSIFIFPKNDRGFIKLQKDFEANALGKKMFVKH